MSERRDEWIGRTKVCWSPDGDKMLMKLGFDKTDLEGFVFRGKADGEGTTGTRTSSQLFLCRK